MKLQLHETASRWTVLLVNYSSGVIVAEGSGDGLFAKRGHFEEPRTSGEFQVPSPQPSGGTPLVPLLEFVDVRVRVENAAADA